MARTRGDEFVVVFGGDQSTGEAAAERILARMREPIAISNEITEVRTSIGEIWTGEKRDLSELMKQADTLLYDAKTAGKDAVRFQSASGSVS